MEEATVFENLPADTANILADCFLCCFTWLVTTPLIPTRGRTMDPWYDVVMT